MSEYTEKVRPRTLRSGLSGLGSGGRSFEEGSHLCLICYIFLNTKERTIEQCHKLLLVLGGDLTLTRSYSERWQAARINCVAVDRGAVCGGCA